MHASIAGTFSDYVLRALRLGASMPPVIARIAGGIALLVAIPIAIVAVLLTALSAAFLLFMKRPRRDAPVRHDDGPVVIEGEYTVIEEPRAREPIDAARLDRRR